MPIVTILLVLLFVGVIMWAINHYVPMEAPWRQILNLAVVLLVVIWLLEHLGVLHSVMNARV